MAMLDLGGLLGGRDKGGGQLDSETVALANDQNDPNQVFEDEQIRNSMINQAPEESQYYLVIFDPTLRVKVLLNPTNNSLDDISARYTVEEARPIQALLDLFVIYRF